MNQIKWKVCGLRDNIVEVAALQPDYIGFIFYAKSPRYVGENFVLPELANSKINKVGVFVNESLDIVHNTLVNYQLDYVQLHGNESPEFCENLIKKNVKIIKAFHVDETFDFGYLKAYELVTDYFLFDTKTNKYGGSGKSFNWNILKKYYMDKKYFLSGGLSIDNIDELLCLDLSKVHALDVNSKFEISSGSKNIALLEELGQKIAGYNKKKIITE